MISIGYALSFLATLAVSAVAQETLYPPVNAGLHRIIDFQSLSVDITNGEGVEFAPVQAYTSVNNANQFWDFQTTNMTSEFILYNEHATTVLSYPSYSRYQFQALHSQACGIPGSGTRWKIVPCSRGYNIIESVSGLALTSWQLRNTSQSVPLTLEGLSQNDQQQLFSLQIIYPN